MKKLVTLFLSAVLLVLFLIPVSAADVSDEKNTSTYRVIETIEKQLSSKNKIIVSVRFDELSSKAKSYISSDLGIDSSKAGKVMYYLDDDVLTLQILTENSITSITNYGKDKNGNIGRLDNLDLISDFSDVNWSSLGVSNYIDRQGIRLSATIYYYAYTPDSYMTMYIRPYSSSFSYDYISSETPSITNLFAQVYSRGALYTYDLQLINPEYVCADYYNISAPIAGNIYTRYNGIATNTMMKLTNLSGDFFADCTFLYNGVERYFPWQLG